jgi:hypothetical protein
MFNVDTLQDTGLLVSSQFSFGGADARDKNHPGVGRLKIRDQPF